MGSVETVGRNKAIDVDAARPCACDRCDLDMANCSGRNPWKDVLDLIVRQGRILRTAQDREYLRSCSPRFQMPDQGEIEIDRLTSRGYTGN